MKIPFPNSRLTFDPRNPKDSAESRALSRADRANSLGYELSTSLAGLDHSAFDLDPRDGYVRVEDYSRGRDSGSITATLTPSTLQAEVVSVKRNPLFGERFTVEQHERKVRDGRVVQAAYSKFVSGRDYLPDATDATWNPDGTLTVVEGTLSEMPYPKTGLGEGVQV